MPAVSIIIRAKNEEYWLPRLLGQLRKQTFQDFEVILVDNESTDATQPIFKKEMPAGRILEIGNFKPGRAINAGIEAARGTFIVIISAHCVPADEGWLKSFVSVMDDPSIGAAYGRQLPMHTSHPLDKRDLLNTFGIEFRVQKKDTFFHNANSILRRSIWEKFPFDEETPHIEDRIWAARLIENGIWIAYAPDAVVYHHHGINHHANIRRAEAISQILGSGSLGYSAEVPEFMRPENSRTLYCFLGHDRGTHANLLSILGSMKSAPPGRVIVHSSAPELLREMAGPDVLPYAADDRDRTFVEILSELLESEAKREFFPDGVVYINLRSEGLSWKYMQEAIQHYYGEMFESVFWANREYSNIWQKEDGVYSQLRADYTRRERKEPVYVARYGLGTVTTPALVRSGALIGRKVAILPLEDHKAPSL